MSDLPQAIDQTIRKHRLLARRARILVAVSGGLDSMVLLRVLHQLAGVHDWRLVVAHFNHLLRGANSDADEQLVRRTARRLSLPFVVERVKVKALARERKISLEMAAREARHQFLAKAARQLRIRKVALAHHADDQLELFFLRLLRGSGGEGLAGMKWNSPSPSDHRIQLVRPLLETSKETLRDYARSWKVTFREDATNTSLDVQRNRVRHELLPLLRQKYQPALSSTVKRAADIAGAETDLATRLAARWLTAVRQHPCERRATTGIKTESPPHFEDLHVAVQRRCLFLQLIELGITPEFQLIEQLRAQAGRPVVVPRTSTARTAVFRGEEGFLQKTVVTRPVFEESSLKLDLGDEPGMAEFEGLKLSWKTRARRGAGGCKPMPRRELFDRSKVGETVMLRHWLPGDRFQPIGMRCAVKLQDLFTNCRIPRHERHRLVVAATADGEIFWVEGLRIADRFKLTKSTTRRLAWAWQRLSGH